MNVTVQIEEIIDRETRAWDARDVTLLLSVFHPDMVWAWPPDAQAHDPSLWVFVMGRYDYERWKQLWQTLFDTHTLVHNHRATRKIVVTDEGDGAFAVVDVDTLWRDQSDRDFHWRGRACKVYTKIGAEWKMITQTGLLDYDHLK